MTTTRPGLSLSISLAAALGCGHAAAPPPIVAAKAPAPAPALPALYAGLFVDGATLAYTVTHIHDEPGEDGGPRDHSETPEPATCRVTAVERHGGAYTSTIECEGASIDGIAGTWAADARGLWYEGTGPIDVAELDVANALLVASPEAHRLEPSADDASGFYLEVEQRGDAWCVTSGTTQGDESWESQCFRGGVLASGSTGACGFACDQRDFALR